ncbi:hypothetical protein OIU84_027419 [Salix udensis]|uniref:Uncharacterized protein n=1 Tax=Salix udensis TaxID=889485 RepID=A0AAD6KFB6_9ROSI|nr:hypothetical protein OIU84_027419 [Salix udensis]
MKFNFEFKNYVMVEEATKAMEPNADMLEWPKKDKHRLLHVVYSSGDLERTINLISKFKNYVMVEEAAKAMEPNTDLLEWPKKDKHRLLHAVYSSGDLERTIK